MGKDKASNVGLTHTSLSPAGRRTYPPAQAHNEALGSPFRYDCTPEAVTFVPHSFSRRKFFKAPSQLRSLSFVSKFSLISSSSSCLNEPIRFMSSSVNVVPGMRNTLIDGIFSSSRKAAVASPR